MFLCLKKLKVFLKKKNEKAKELAVQVNHVQLVQLLVKLRAHCGFLSTVKGVQELATLSRYERLFDEFVQPCFLGVSENNALKLQ